ncbi:MAG: hypothetical protein MRY83_12510, partial [Flavobacteriales bacterium]|nr:hypothetical protein [Flavobacteriales bacterium]
MNEEILKALIEFFAIINRQIAGNVSIDRKYIEQFLRSHLSKQNIDGYLDLYDQKSIKKNISEADDSKTSMRDSVRVIGICKKINKTLDLDKKIIVLVRLFEFVKTTGLANQNGVEIIKMAADVFGLQRGFDIVFQFINYDNINDISTKNICIISKEKFSSELFSQIQLKQLD